MLTGILLAIAGLFIVLGIVFALGKGAGLIAGYNTASRKEKEQTDEKKLLRAMSGLMFVFAGCFLLSACGEFFCVKALIPVGQALFVAALIAGVIYLNTGSRFKK